MKKVIVALGLFMFMSIPQAFGADCFSQYCPTEPYQVSSNISQNVQKYTGFNWAARTVAQSVIKRELKKETKGTYKVDLQPYSAKDLLNGKFKSLHFVGTNLETDGIYVSKFEGQTLCNFNSVELVKNSIKFRENMTMRFNMEISSMDLRRTVNSTGYLKMLNKINLSGFGITFFKLSSADVCVKNNKMYFTINVTTPLSSKSVPIVLSSDVKVSDGKIVLTQLDFANSFRIIDLNKLTYLINSLDPLSMTTNILNNKDSKIKIDSVNIVGTKICVEGFVLIPKNTIQKG